MTDRPHARDSTGHDYTGRDSNMRDKKPVSSRIAGFYKKTMSNRVQLIADSGLLSDDSRGHLLAGGGLGTEIADRMSENVIGSHGLPFSLALNFRINDRDVLVPMSVEEPSIVAAASNAARLVRLSGGFVGEAEPSIMTTQIQLDDVPDAASAPAKLDTARESLIDAANRSIPNMVRRGGGCRDLETRVLDIDSGVVVVHLYIDVGNAMGANVVDTVAEAVAPTVRKLIGGEVGLRILSNLPMRRRVRVSARVSNEAVGGQAAAEGILRASRFASLDPYRAVTHNKGIMNGVDAVAVATGQDWRSIEAGAHAYASVEGQYKPLATWTASDDDTLEGRLEMPLAVGTVGGSTQIHPGVRAAFDLMQVENSQDLAVIMGAAGLASNLAALKALAGEGIQHGHMRLHHRKQAVLDAQQEATRTQAEGDRA